MTITPFTQAWEDVGFVHFRYAANVLKEHLPSALEPDVLEGSGWVSLVLFHLVIRPLGGPAIPHLMVFPETNVRTYVRDSSGAAGIWFFSLDAPRLAAVLGGRLAYGLPYRWSPLSIRRRGRLWTYESDGARRRAPSSRVAIEAGSFVRPEEKSGLDTFLTERYVLFHERRGKMLRSEVEHAPWRLHRARVVEMWQDLSDAAGLPAPGAPTLAHFSPGVEARFSWPSPVASVMRTEVATA